MIVEVPAATPVTTPELLTVATAVLALVHAPPAVVLVRVVVLPTQTAAVPVMAATEGSGLTVRVTAAALIGHPPTVAVPVRE